MLFSQSQAHTHQRLLRLAWLCAALVLAVTSLSAFIRLSRAGLDCNPWPQCYAQAQELAAQDTATQSLPPAVTVARMAHRIVASSSLLLILVLLAGCWRQNLWPQARMALGLMLLAVFLGVLGAATGASQRPAVTLGNLLGGGLMFALSVRLAFSMGACHRRYRCTSLTKGAWILFILVALQAALGALVSSNHAGLSCPTLGSCTLPPDSAWQALNPWHQPALGTLPTHAQGALVHLAHRMLGMAVWLGLLFLAWRAWTLGQRLVALMLAGLPCLLVAMGLAIVHWQLPLMLVMVHNLGAALLLALLLTLTLAQRPS